MMYDDLVRRLRKCATEAGACKTCELDSNPSCTDVLMEQAADAIEELQTTLCNWCAVCPEDKRDLSTCEIYESCRAKSPKEE